MEGTAADGSSSEDLMGLEVSLGRELGYKWGELAALEESSGPTIGRM